MNKTAYLVSHIVSGKASLYVTTTTGGPERALSIFNTALGYKTNFASVILARPENEAQRMQNTVALFARTSPAVRNLRKNRISNDEAAQKDLVCGLTISAIRGILKAEANYARGRADEFDAQAKTLSSAARRKF